MMVGSFLSQSESTGQRIVLHSMPHTVLELIQSKPVPRHVYSQIYMKKRVLWVGTQLVYSHLF